MIRVTRYPVSYYARRAICIIIFEAFSKRHIELIKLDPKVGGPTEIDMLYSTAEIMAGFENYEVLVLEEAEILLNEGKYHLGKGSVIRFVGRKKNYA